MPAAAAEPGVGHARRLAALEALLHDHRLLWQAQPFKEPRPAWCAHYPALTASLLGLTDEQLNRLGQHEGVLWQWLGNHLPPLAGLSELCRMALLPAASLPSPGPHFSNHIPGRKWEQITAFAAAVTRPAAPLLEWCGGKGHLGRLLGWQHRQPVLTLELDKALCSQGEQLARRSGVAQQFQAVDVLATPARGQLAGHHALALHACGELHRELLREAVRQRLPALDLAPCCYHHLLTGDYTALSGTARLVLRRDDLRLAVTGAVTAAPRELRRRDQEMAWKLGYLALRQGLTGEPGYRAIRPIDKDWLRLDFAGFCRALAARDGEALPAQPDWARFEQAGWQRQRETMRLSLLRQGFRRAIELYLIFDMACFLEDHGYRVVVGEFCARPLTPRNLLISARLQK